MSENIVYTVKTAGFEMDYMKFGKGSKQLVILPGMSITSVMSLSDYCVETYKIFLEDYTVYLFDRRKEFDSDYSIEQMGDDTAAAMKVLGIADADFLGISQGGMISQVIAEKYPELVHKLVLASSASRGNETSDAVFKEWIRLAEKGDIEELVSNFVDKAYTERTAKLCKKGVIALNRCATELDKRNFVVMAKSCMKNNGYEALDKIECPTFIVGAEQDLVLTALASVEMYEKLKAKGSSCEIYMYKGYNHAIYAEAPDFQKRVLDFFKKDITL